MMPAMPQQITPQMIQQFMAAQQPQGQSPMSAPGAGNMPPPMAAGQINPNVLAFMQAMKGGQPPQQPPQAPQGPPMSPQMMAMLAKRQQMMKNQVMGQQLAAQGRGGDTQIAHMTPGEIAVPPQVQSPKVLATLRKAFEAKHVSPAQFTVGSGVSSHNPATGQPEYNFMSAFLPAALGMTGAALAPMTGGASLLGSEAAAAAIGGGLGSTAGGLLAGETPLQAGLGGLGSAVGGYALGGGLSGAGGAANIAGNGAMTRMPSTLPSLTPTNPILGSQWLGNAVNSAMNNPGRIIGSAAGGYIGNAIGAPQKNVGPQLPPGFNNPLQPAGNFQQQLGYNNYQGPMPNFNGFNPATNNPGAWNFFPPAT